jgi:hypothetical protein
MAGRVRASFHVMLATFRSPRVSVPARLVVGVVALATGLAALAVRPAVAAMPPHFIVAPLPNPDGVTTPRNQDVEPGIGIDGAGTIWIGSNIDGNTGNDPRTNPGVGVLTGSDLWRSTDGGKTFQWVSDPYGLNGASSFGLGGEDSDAAVAPEKNSNGFYNVYSTSLFVAASSLAWSQDGGATFQLLNLGGVPAQDRPWLAADGPCVFYLVYHQLPLFLPVANKYDVCNGNTIVSTPQPTINPVSQSAIFAANSLPGATNGFNKQMVDTWPASPHRHNIYVPMEACNLSQPQDFLNNLVTTAEQLPLCPSGVDTQVEVASSSDGGSTWTTSIVGMNSNGEQQVWPTSLAVGPDGSVYVAWGDNHNAYTSVSHDAGATWSPMRQLNVAPVGTADYPTIAVAPDGHVDVAFYGSTTKGNTNDSAGMGAPGDPKSAPWRLYLARSLDGGASFTQQALTGVIHTGILCTMGAACPGGGARNLYDDFGVAVSRVTNLTTIAFDADQPPTGAPADKAVDPYTAYATEVAPPTSAASSGSSPGGAPGAGPAAATAPATGAAAGTPNTSALPAAGGVGLAVAGVLLLASTAGRRRRR